MPTKNETYAALTKLGFQRGYDVIPECRLRISNDRIKVVDLVWAKPIENPTLCSKWTIEAAFEVEGCDVPLWRIHEHMNDAILLGLPTRLFVALYSSSCDRSEKWRPFGPGNKIAERHAIAPSKIFSLDAPANWSSLLPTSTWPSQESVITIG